MIRPEISDGRSDYTLQVFLRPEWRLARGGF